MTMTVIRLEKVIKEDVMAVIGVLQTLVKSATFHFVLNALTVEGSGGSREKAVCSILQYKYFYRQLIDTAIYCPHTSILTIKLFLKGKPLRKEFYDYCLQLLVQKKTLYSNLFFTKQFSFSVIYSEELIYFKKGWA